MNKSSKRLIIAVSLMLAVPALARPTGIGNDMHPRDKFTSTAAARRFIHFTAAFSFELIPRSPPELGRSRVFKGIGAKRIL